MIIPIKCFSCGKVIADKYRYYINTVQLRKKEKNIPDVVYLTNHNTEKSIEGVVLDELNITRMCCRRHMLTHVDIN
jgi:DNA-directed RNA polymerase subunit N (RpoN/RPB10)